MCNFKCKGCVPLVALLISLMAVEALCSPGQCESLAAAAPPQPQPQPAQLGCPGCCFFFFILKYRPQQKQLWVQHLTSVCSIGLRSRDERRWIEKQNRASRAQRKKEEMNRIRTLVGTHPQSGARCGTTQATRQLTQFSTRLCFCRHGLRLRPQNKEIQRRRKSPKGV